MKVRRVSRSNAVVVGLGTCPIGRVKWSNEKAGKANAKSMFLLRSTTIDHEVFHNTAAGTGLSYFVTL